MTDYDKMIETKKKELARIEGQVVTVSAELSRKIKEGNTVIYSNKDKAEKIIADAKSEAEKIIAAAGEAKDKNEVESKRLKEEGKDLKDKQSEYEKAQDNLAKAVEKLEKDKADFAKEKKDKLVEINSAIKKSVQVIDYVQSVGKAIADKVSDITKE